MNQRLLTLVVSLWLFISLPLHAQLGLTFPDVNDAYPGQVLNLPLVVINFDSVATAQFVIRWDPTVLSFEELNSFDLPGLDLDDHFGLGETNSGILRFGWLASQTIIDNGGVTKPDGSFLFKIKFTVVGADTSSTNVAITEITPNTVFEITTVSGKVYELENTFIDNGFVAVGFIPVSAGEPAALQGISVDLFPNPVVDKTTLRLDLSRASNVRILICDAAGRILSDEKKYFLAGQHGTEIDNTLFRVQTTYYLIVQSNGQTFVKTFFLM